MSTEQAGRARPWRPSLRLRQPPDPGLVALRRGARAALVIPLAVLVGRFVIGDPQNLIFIKGASQPELEAFRAYWRNDIEGQGMAPIIGGADVKTAALRGSEAKRSRARARASAARPATAAPAY